ncbi:MAG TPA: hypothetical protein VN408_33635 [Actinoplanes sp.]|nr:hypothetical protein [Actinoplanes sp.]
MAPSLILIHGRSQAGDARIASDPARLAAHVAAKRRTWLGGLANGLIRAGQPPVDESTVLFPFYGNVFADTIARFQQHGGRTPDLELMDRTEPAVTEVRSRALLETAAALDFDAARELGYLDPEAAEQELGFGDLLRSPVLRAALQFVARKTGVPEVVIENFLDDVACYLRLPEMRRTVLDVVRNELTSRFPDGRELVVIGHSLGSVVAYDLLTELPGHYPVRQLVTAGSPLGLPVVQRNLLGAGPDGKPPIPAPVPDRDGAWLNAYDVLDVVALEHPLAGRFHGGRPGRLRDERTHNPSGPHSIADYLSDPDVAGPIGRALRF